ncbi:hypothetical protein KEM48_009820, partial [Puccinia striiformis f. sp. tritici PST-130]
LRNYLQQCKLILNDIDSFSSDLKKTLYAAAFLTGKAFEWVQPYLELVTLYGDPNELRATEYKLDSLTMKDGDHAFNYISSFRALNLAYQDGETGLPTRVLDLLAQNTEVFDTLLELIEATLKIDTRHHERQKEKKRENDSQPSQPKKDTSKTASSSTPSTSRNPSTSKSTSKPLLKSPSSSSEPMQWLSKKTLWTFKISSFPTFTWECLVIDATGNDDAILGYDFLTHWNPDINWSEGLIIP